MHMLHVMRICEVCKEAAYIHPPTQSKLAVINIPLFLTGLGDVSFFRILCLS